MRTEGTAPVVRPPAVSPEGVLFLYSPNLGLRVRYGSLVIDLGRDRVLTISRATEPRLRRLVLCGYGGWWTFEVPSWLRGVGASWLHLDLAGRILGSGPDDVSPDMPALRRAQALASGTDAGIEIGRDLLTLKILGQAAALSGVDGIKEAQEGLREYAGQLTNCANTVKLRTLEARAAGLFWQALAEVPVRFTAADEPRVPVSWRMVGRRSSSVTGSPRGASTPAHALWNFAYACAASEVGIALRSVGLDPGISPTGLHADTVNRPGATWDVIEAIRGDIDRLILAMVPGRRFRRRDFVEQTDGRVRLTAPIARELAEAVLPVARRAVAPIAEKLARTLAREMTGTRSHIPRVPTNLSGDARSRGRNGIRRGSRPVGRTHDGAARSLLPAACRGCGVVFDDPADKDRRLCRECRSHLDIRRGSAMGRAGAAALAGLRAEGRNPSATQEARRKLSESMTRRNRERAEWDRTHPGPHDPEPFRREVLPRLQLLPLSALMAATGLTRSHVWRIRRGDMVPHPMHWERLAALAEGAPGD